MPITIKIDMQIKGMKLSESELSRYARNIIMPEIGVVGQEKLKQARVLIVGMGGLGSPAALYLAACGVGTIGIVDFDRVEMTNLQRQIIHSEKDIGKAKTQSAKEKIEKINPEIKAVVYNERLTPQNALEIIKGYDIVVDGSDNFPTLYLINDACVLLKKPNVQGNIYRFQGQVSVFGGGGPCFRCLLPEPPPQGLMPTCEEGGVLGSIPGIIGTIQATEVVKLIIGKGNPLIGRLLVLNGLDMKFTELKISKNPYCPVCGETPTIRNLIDYEEFCKVKPEGPSNENEITCEELKKLMGNKKVGLIDVREKWEWNVCHIEGANLIPMGELENKTKALDKSKLYVTYCHTGVRSLNAQQFMKSLGFNVKSLIGGIEEWAEKIEPGMGRY